jgi:hypothetical protein
MMLLADALAKTGEAAKSGPIGLAIILILCVGCYFLFRSMAKHLRKVREEFPQEPSSEESPASTGTGMSRRAPDQPPGQPPAAE